MAKKAAPKKKAAPPKARSKPSGKQAVSYDEFDRTDEERQPSVALDRLHEMANEVMEAQASVAEIEALLSSAKARLRQVEEIDLPDAMASVGLSEFKTKDGAKVSIRDMVWGSLPKEEGPRMRAIAWIERNEGESLIKTEVSTKFGKEEHEKALKLAADLTKKGYEVKTDHGVHPQSLYAWVKELVRDGKPVDFELLGLTPGRKAVITLPKPPKGG